MATEAFKHGSCTLTSMRTGHLRLFRDAAIHWVDDSTSVHGAALAYYTVFSIAPLVLIAIAISGLVFGAEASRGEIFKQIEGLLGTAGAQSIQGLVASAARRKESGVIAAVIGFFTLGLGAASVFSQLQTSLNMIWKVTTEPGRGIWVFLRRRLMSFSMVVVIGFILMVTLLISAAVAALGNFVSSWLPGGEAIWQVAQSLVSFGVTALLFAAVLKVLPDVKLAWRDVWLGAVVTSLLFTVGKLGIGLYLGHSSVASSYGAAGSLVLILLWVFYASQILFFGAEFTKAHALAHGRRIEAKDGARLLDETYRPSPPEKSKIISSSAA